MNTDTYFLILWRAHDQRKFEQDISLITVLSFLRHNEILMMINNKSLMDVIFKSNWNVGCHFATVFRYESTQYAERLAFFIRKSEKHQALRQHQERLGMLPTLRLLETCDSLQEVKINESSTTVC